MSSSNTGIVPRIKDMRAIALPAGWYETSKDSRHNFCSWYSF
jgi:hypothetical protein